MSTLSVRKQNECWHVYNKFVEKGGGKRLRFTFNIFLLFAVESLSFHVILMQNLSWTPELSPMVSSCFFFSLLVLWSSVQPRLPWQSFHVVLPGTPEESQPCCIMKARKSKMAFPVDTAPLNFWPVYHWKSTQVTRFSITSRRSGRSRVRLCARLTYGWTGFGDSTTSCSFCIFFPYVEKKHLGRDSQFELQVDFLCHVHKLVQNKQDWQTGAATSTLPMRFCPQVF